VCREIQDFLGVEQKPVSPTTLQQNVRPLRDAIANWDELYQHLKGGPWERFLT